MLGTFGYYRKWIKGYAGIVDPLNALLKANVGIPRQEDGTVKFTEDQLDAIATIKKALVDPEGLILAHPDWTLPFEIHCDASLRGLGATLVQAATTGEKVVCYASKALTPGQRQYPAHELETLALDWAGLRVA